MDCVQGFGERLRALQCEIAASGVDALVLVNGSDGCYNRGSAACTQHLFRNRWGAALRRRAVLTSEFEESLAVITATRAAFLLHECVYRQFAGALLAVAARVQLASEELCADRERFEARKIAFFVEETARLGAIGVAVEDGRSPSAIEAWPLMKAMAFEGIGGSFFSLRHKMIDLAASVDRVLSARSADWLLQDLVPACERAAKVFGEVEAQLELQPRADTEIACDAARRLLAIVNDEGEELSHETVFSVEECGEGVPALILRAVGVPEVARTVFFGLLNLDCAAELSDLALIYLQLVRTVGRVPGATDPEALQTEAIREIADFAAKTRWKAEPAILTVKSAGSTPPVLFVSCEVSVRAEDGGLVRLLHADSFAICKAKEVHTVFCLTKQIRGLLFRGGTSTRPAGLRLVGSAGGVRGTLSLWAGGVLQIDVSAKIGFYEQGVLIEGGPALRLWLPVERICAVRQQVRHPVHTAFDTRAALNETLFGSTFHFSTPDRRVINDLRAVKINVLCDALSGVAVTPRHPSFDELREMVTPKVEGEPRAMKVVVADHSVLDDRVYTPSNFLQIFVSSVEEMAAACRSTQDGCLLLRLQSPCWPDEVVEKLGDEGIDLWIGEIIAAQLLNAEIAACCASPAVQAALRGLPTCLVVRFLPDDPAAADAAVAVLHRLKESMPNVTLVFAPKPVRIEGSLIAFPPKCEAKFSLSVVEISAVLPLNRSFLLQQLSSLQQTGLFWPPTSAGDTGDELRLTKQIVGQSYAWVRGQGAFIERISLVCRIEGELDAVFQFEVSEKSLLERKIASGVAVVDASGFKKPLYKPDFLPRQRLYLRAFVRQGPHKSEWVRALLASFWPVELLESGAAALDVRRGFGH